MYTQIFKEILLDMKYDRQSVKNFVIYCRIGDLEAPDNITRFENEYDAKLAIGWYTFPSFMYSMLNGALLMLEADTIIKMGFFICDLHHQIEQLHQQQVGDYHGQPFIVYRGQGLGTIDFEKLLKTKGGLISFNNFLSTSKDRELSFGFAMSALTKTDTVGILFQKDKQDDYQKAIWYYEKALEIGQKTVLPNHSLLATVYNNIGVVYYNIGEYSKAVSYFERALDIRQRSLPSNHPGIQNLGESIEFVKKKLSNDVGGIKKNVFHLLEIALF